jgi:RND family efflux transporter MFP subunit
MKYLILPLLVFFFGYYPNAAVAIPTEFDCLIKPGMSIELSSPIDTVIDTMLVKPGDRVIKGQALVMLESSVERARVNLAQLQASSVSDIENRKVQLKYTQLNYRRIKSLYAKKSISKFEWDKSNTELALAKIELDKAQEKIDIALLSLELAQAQLALRTLTSPINGIVVDLNANVGESIADRSIMQLAQINPLKVELIASAEYLGLIHSGMEVDIRPERPENRLFNATVTVVDQLIDSASGTFIVRMALPNLGNELVAGVNCLASINLDIHIPSGKSNLNASAESL